MLKNIHQNARWQERQGSNPQPPVLETGALPVELHSFFSMQCQTLQPSLLQPNSWGYIPISGLRKQVKYFVRFSYSNREILDIKTSGPRTAHHFLILDTTPAPTVLPPSRIAKRRPSSIATGLISLIVKLALSPGITISFPVGSSISPVTSVVLK